MPGLKVDSNVILQFLTQLYGFFEEDEWLTVNYLVDDRLKTKWYPLKEKALKQASQDAVAIVAGEHDVWFGIGAREKKLKKGRGRDRDVSRFPGLWVDIDYKDKNAHKGDLKIPRNFDAAIDILLAFDLEPTITIHSGHGLQAYWLFDEPTEVSQRDLDGWAAAWRQHADRHSVHIDNTFDRPRIFRLPGTVNFKTDPVPVEILTNTNIRYGLSELRDVFGEPVEAGHIQPEEFIKVGTRPSDQDDRPGSIFNREVSCGQVFQLAGWELIDQSNGEEHWRRPGKDKGSASATVYPNDGKAIFWTDAIDGASPKDDFDPLGLYALLFHEGNLSKAAKTLHGEGFKKDVNKALADRYGYRPEAASEASVEPERSGDSTDDAESDPERSGGRSSGKKRKLVPLWERRVSPPLPVGVLGDELGAFIEHCAEVFQAPEDLAFVGALGGIAASATEARQSVEVRPGWVEPSNLYLVGVAAPSEHKSPIMGTVLSALRRVSDKVEQESIERYEDFKVQKDILEGTITALKNSIVKQESEKADVTAVDQRKRLKEALIQLTEMDEVFPRQLLADDVTPEACALLLHKNGGRLAFLSSEGTMLSQTARYTSGGDPQLGPLLKSWSGDEIRVNRVAEDRKIVVPNPHLTIALMAQPTVIENLYADKTAVGTGLTSRFMVSYPMHRRGTRDFLSAPELNEGVVDDLGVLFGTLFKMQPRIWEMSPKALEYYLEWKNSIEEELKDGGLYVARGYGDVVESYTGKVSASVARLALLLFLSERPRPSDRIKRQHIARAIEIGEYWLATAVTLRDNANPPDNIALAITCMRNIVMHYRKNGSEEPEFRVRDLQRRNVGAYRREGKNERPDPDEYREAVAMLGKHGWLKNVNGDPNHWKISKKVRKNPQIIKEIVSNTNI